LTGGVQKNTVAHLKSRLGPPKMLAGYATVQWCARKKHHHQSESLAIECGTNISTLIVLFL